MKVITKDEAKRYAYLCSALVDHYRSEELRDVGAEVYAKYGDDGMDEVWNAIGNLPYPTPRLLWCRVDAKWNGIGGWWT